MDVGANLFPSAARISPLISGNHSAGGPGESVITVKHVLEARSLYTFHSKGMKRAHPRVQKQYDNVEKKSINIRLFTSSLLQLHFPHSFRH